MALPDRVLKKFFPLQNTQDVVNLFRDQLENSEEPNLALLSIVVGTIENILTVNRAVQDIDEKNLVPIFPVVEASVVDALYQKFIALVQGSVDLTLYKEKYSNRELIKRVADVVWAQLPRSYYKDKAHLQSLFSFLTVGKLDCFGVALAVVAASQVLGLSDVHLALSEDHAWVVFGEDGESTAEVTWHGKGVEDKRGQPVSSGITERSWLYLCGHAVICTRQMEVAALVSGINPAINATMDSVEMGSLQQELLWLLYDMGHIEKYPMAIGNLGDLEEISPTPGRPSSLVLFNKAINSARVHYKNMHVYPYTYLGGYHFRHRHFKEAIAAWSEAACVIRKYNYHRDDEEIYKEFLEIANDYIPNIVKHCAETTSLSDTQGRIPLLQDPECYKMLLQMYDGICQWEEDSSTPVLHVGWAKNLCFTLGKFDSQARESLDVFADGEEEDEEEEEDVEPKQKVNGETDSKPTSERKKRRRLASIEANHKLGSVTEEKDVNGGSAEEESIRSTIQELESKVGAAENSNDAPNPNIAALAQACGDAILNPEYLLSGGEPFTSASLNVPNSGTASVTAVSTTSTNTVTSTGTSTSPFASGTDTRLDLNEFLSTKTNSSPFCGMTMDSMLKAESPADMLICKTHTDRHAAFVAPGTPSATGSERSTPAMLNMGIATPLTLHSMKMKGLKSLLTTTKLNASAIKLQLTAQSQVQLKHSKVSSEYQLPRKRARRDAH